MQGKVHLLELEGFAGQKIPFMETRESCTGVMLVVFHSNQFTDIILIKQKAELHLVIAKVVVLSLNNLLHTWQVLQLWLF